MFFVFSVRTHALHRGGRRWHPMQRWSQFFRWYPALRCSDSSLDLPCFRKTRTQSGEALQGKCDRKAERSAADLQQTRSQSAPAVTQCCDDVIAPVKFVPEGRIEAQEEFPQPLRIQLRVWRDGGRKGRKGRRRRVGGSGICQR